MNNDNENVDWDKVNRGKVRYGFALELYKKSGKLTKTKIGEIEAFVDYVMLGIDVIDNDKKVGKDKLMTIDGWNDGLQSQIWRRFSRPSYSHGSRNQVLPRHQER